MKSESYFQPHAAHFARAYDLAEERAELNIFVMVDHPHTK
jgi:hypothetical protein